MLDEQGKISHIEPDCEGLDTNCDSEKLHLSVDVDNESVMDENDTATSSDVEALGDDLNMAYDVREEVSSTEPVSPGIPTYPNADDFENLARRLMKPVPDYPVKESSKFIWEIKDWAAAKRENKLTSPLFECGGFQWSILLFPKGNSDAVSLYLEPHPPADVTGSPDPNWYICAQFAFDVWNPSHPASHYPSASTHRFSKNETDWGFSSFILSRDLTNPTKTGHSHPILENNQLNITGFVRVIDDSSTGVLWSNFMNYDSKVNTGYVGLNNQGATCYLNSLLQSYFTTRCFRNLVCQIPTSDHVSVESSKKNSKAVALALQRIFYLLHTSDEPVGTLELTKSFGWDSSEAFTQHDVQELNRVLMDKLESAMKGSGVGNRLNDIFVGKMKSFIKCVNVSYESSRIEDFWDIQLNVKGMKNLQESFENYIEIEMLDGENKYQAGDEYGYQDAKKGVVFQSFPPVLHLQLKRFEYDFMIDDLVKIDDFYEFPDRIDLRPYLDNDLDPAVKNENWIYKLHGVLVHQGSISNGHYYAMIKPEGTSNTWLRFDDDKVWKVTQSQVFKENFGAVDLSPDQMRMLGRYEQNEYMIRKATSAYMLVYYREEDLQDILPEILTPVPEHVSLQIEKEREEFLRLEKLKQESLFYLHVKIVTAENFTYFNGFDICPDPHKAKEYDTEIFDKKAYPITIKMKKDAKLSTLYELVASRLGYASHLRNNIETNEGQIGQTSEPEAVDVSTYPFSLMIMKQRNNKTTRPDLVVSDEFLNESVNDVYNKCFRRRYDELSFFVCETSRELRNIKNGDSLTSPRSLNFETLSSRISSNESGVSVSDDENLVTLFLKYYDPVSDSVRGLTFVKTNKNSIVSSLTTDINRVLGFPASTPLEFYEEISRVKVEAIDDSLSLEKCELGTGDVLAVQVNGCTSMAPKYGCGDIQNYYKFLLTRLHVQVSPCKVGEAEQDNDFVAVQDQSVDDANGLSFSDAENPTSSEVSETKFDLWVSTTFSYQELAAQVAHNLGPEVNPNYLRLFVINNHGTRHPLASTISLSQIFTRQVAVSSKSQIEYEILNISLKEYESMKAIKIYWLESIYQDHLLDLLVPRSSTVFDLIQKLVQKLELEKQKLSGLLVWAGQDNKYVDLIKFDRSINDLGDDIEIYCGYFPTEVEILVSHDMFKRFIEPEVEDGSDIADLVIRSEFQKARKFSKSLNIIPVFHFHKSTTYTHSKPFVFAAFPEEPYEDTRGRLRKKLGLGEPAFEKIRLALADVNDKGKYLDVGDDGFSLLEEISRFESHVSLALDHRDRNPRRSNPLDKGISIG